MTDTARKGTAAPDADIDCGAGRRNRYFRAKRLKAADFLAEQTYSIERRRLINRAVIGWGVVYGFALPNPRPLKATRVEPAPKAEIPDPVKPKDGDLESPARAEATAPADAKADAVATAPKPEQPPPNGAAEIEPFDLTVGKGFAFDEEGREIVVASTQTLGQANTFLLQRSPSGWRPVSLVGAKPGCYVMSVHYAERPVGLVMGSKDCGCGPPQANYLCETAVFSLRLIDCGKCPCGEDACPSCGGCFDDACCASGRGPHGRLCAWTAEAPDDPEGCLPLWNGLNVAIGDGVPLARLRLAETGDRCKPLSVSSIDDACGPRRIVKNNDLLYDLIRGCDLTHISDYSWKAWHRSTTDVPWADFAKRFRAPGGKEGVTDFWVRFSGPVRTNCLRPDAIIITAYGVDQGTGWRIGRRVPISELDPTPSVSGLPAGTTDQFRVLVRRGWLNDELGKDDKSFFTQRRFIIEIEIRGDLIEDCSGQPVDGNSVGVRAVPSGDGTPGGTYLSSFIVAAKPTNPDDDE